mmetsp:Transcript_132399/g.295204  ORF Transcript_132399/g.295204 Transcript_132399/m.295204 type:complete len:666 (+) Transcript_132399:2-1999(+)
MRLAASFSGGRAATTVHRRPPPPPLTPPHSTQWSQRRSHAAAAVALSALAVGGGGSVAAAACGSRAVAATRARRRARRAPCAVSRPALAPPAVGEIATPQGEEHAVPSGGTGEAEATQVARRPPLRLRRGDGGEGISAMMLTTPLFYSNGAPHIGSAYPTIASDVMARYTRLRGAQVHFVTGMDEHGEKIARTAAGKGQQPQELVDNIADEFKGLWERLSIAPDHFARTTLPVHREIVSEMWQRCLAKGDIYQKDYQGWYCVGCEAYLDEDEMLEGHVCKIHRKECELRSENNYFFKLSKYWDRVIAHLKANPDFILPTSRRNEVLSWLQEDNRRDFSISRASTSWGIPVPGDSSQVIYVWFDALLGYLSSLLQPGDPATLETTLSRGWPADVHVIGKDIMRFHAIYWPAMLMSADLPLPTHICTHGFLTKDGLKMGKSLGNVIEPVPLVEAFGADAVRFFFSACLSFGEDGDFSYEVFIKRVNASLANELGNLVHRILTLCRKNLSEPTAPKLLFDDEELILAHPVYQAAVAAPALVAGQYEQFDFPKAAAAALRIASTANARMNEVEPWLKLKSGDEEERRVALREMLLMAEGVRICAVLLLPLIPDLGRRILTELMGEEGAATADFTWADTEWRWDALPGLAFKKKPVPVFQRIDVEPWKGK